MEKGKIRRLEDLSDEMREIESTFIYEAEEKTDEHIRSYIYHISSMNGHYVCSDLFKETFSQYTESLDSRMKYSTVIHNSAAVLANEMFHLNVNDPSIKKCIFLSGVPGAGKSFLAQSLYMSGVIEEYTMIFEGDISTPTIMDKIKAVKDKGMEAFIIIVNPTLELAQRNAINRSFEIGRGASSQTMARILSRIPEALNNIFREYSDIELAIYNKKTNYDIDYYIGRNYASILNHGSYEEILTKLQNLRLVILEELKKKSDSLKNGEMEEVSEKRGL